jgi:hypothetical protein
MNNVQDPVKPTLTHNRQSWFLITILCLYTLDSTRPPHIFMAGKRKKERTSVAWVRKQTIWPSDRRLSAKLVPNLRIECVAWSAQRTPTAVNLGFLDPEPLLFHSISFSVILTRLSGHRSRPTISHRTRDLWICSQELWPRGHRGGFYGTNPTLNNYIIGFHSLRTRNLWLAQCSSNNTKRLIVIWRTEIAIGFFTVLLEREFVQG